jgi:hypothetical protein
MARVLTVALKRRVMGLVPYKFRFMMMLRVLVVSTVMGDRVAIPTHTRPVDSLGHFCRTPYLSVFIRISTAV